MNHHNNNNNKTKKKTHWMSFMFWTAYSSILKKSSIPSVQGITFCSLLSLSRNQNVISSSKRNQWTSLFNGSSSFPLQCFYSGGGIGGSAFINPKYNPITQQGQQKQQQQMRFKTTSRLEAKKRKKKTHEIITEENIQKNQLHENDHNDNAVNEDNGGGGNDEEVISQFASSYHSPVMVLECINALLSCPRRSNNTSNTNTEETETTKEERTLKTKNPLIFVDGTLGGGGHSEALLSKLGPGDVLFGCDVDPSALSEATKRLYRFTMDAYLQNNNDNLQTNTTMMGPIFVPLLTNFCDLDKVLQNVLHPITGIPILPTEQSQNDNADDETDTDTGESMGVDGFLLDLGVSSHQIDNAQRGFAFMKDGPLDMRMSNGHPQLNETTNQLNNNHHHTSSSRGLTAADICNEFDQNSIINILRQYGDEPRAKSIAKSISSSRPLTTTMDLVNAVSAVTPQYAKRGRRGGRTATLARVFQALRIVVNEEDRALAHVLTSVAPTIVRQGGRFVVLSYHSMEDRMTKRMIRDGTVEDKDGRQRPNIQRDMYGNVLVNGRPRPWKALGKRRKASEEEIEMNSRARSATLRIAERT